jgi:hypothetical protein
MGQLHRPAQEEDFRRRNQVAFSTSSGQLVFPKQHLTGNATACPKSGQSSCCIESFDE